MNLKSTSQPATALFPWISLLFLQSDWPNKESRRPSKVGRIDHYSQVFMDVTGTYMYVQYQEGNHTLSTKPILHERMRLGVTLQSGKVISIVCLGLN